MNGIAQIRRFNRTITQQIGALESNFLGRSRSLGASRVIYEIGDSSIAIRELRARLGLDSGYASRLVTGLAAEGLVKITPSQADARVRILKLTRAGKKELSILNRSSEERAASILEPLSQKQRENLVLAMETVQRILLASNVIIGVEESTSHAAQKCISSYYEELATRFEQGFDSAKSISADPEELTPPDGYLLVATLHGRPVGCGALKVHKKFAEIKRMWVDPDARGLGIGRRILQRLEQIAEEKDVGLLRLETNRSLTEARTLYRSSGYREVAPFNDEPYAHYWFEKRL
ncbi:MAG: bifunctional helix-turn-helix transcriptional regulator/GNAT family N-acetyltransferase [Gammaproteobacteria bacterium]